MRCSILVRFSLVAVIVGVSAVHSARAVNIAGSSSGFGMDVDVTALGLTIDTGPLPAGVSGVAPPPYSLSDTVLAVSVASSIPLVVSGDASADAVTATADSDVDGLPGVRTTEATGGVVGADIDFITLPLIPPGVTLLGLDGTLSSTAEVTGDFGALTATGTTTIESLSLTIGGIVADLSAFVGVSVPPNTVVDLTVFGIADATLILNEQIEAPDSSSIEVNALHLTLGLASIAGDVRLGHSQAQMTAVPEPGFALLLAAGILSVGGIRHWRADAT